MFARNAQGSLVFNDDGSQGHQEPANLRLWNMIILQAKMRFQKYPSPGASHWVHEQYIKHGGQFVTVNEHTRKQKLAIKRYQKRRREQYAAKSEHTKDKEKGHEKGEHNKDDKKD
jgi:hypothetical protein